MMGHGRLTRMGRLIFFVLDKTKNDKTLKKIPKNPNKKSQKKRFMFGKILLWPFVIRKGRPTNIFRKSCDVFCNFF